VTTSFTSSIASRQPACSLSRTRSTRGGGLGWLSVSLGSAAARPASVYPIRATVSSLPSPASSLANAANETTIAPTHRIDRSLRTEDTTAD
jgi:hypothetical protein